MWCRRFHTINSQLADKTHCNDKQSIHPELRHVICMHTGTTENHPLNSCFLAIILLNKKRSNNNTDTFPAGSGRGIKKALAMRAARDRTCWQDFAKSLHANANDINVAKTEN